jgi:K+-transporting ATPase ATPase C chain
VVTLIHQHTNGRAWGVLGEKTVNVLDLNVALDRLGS